MDVFGVNNPCALAEQTLHSGILTEVHKTNIMASEEDFP